ncbi:MAG: universal stress protein [Acidimicrobiia bacterium]|nr:universal stress protein [Acidimicrobiia bacterium]
MIVVAVDASPGAEAAARKAVSLAKRLGTPLHAVHAVHIPATVYAAMGAVPDASAEIVRLERDAVWDRIGPILEGVDAERVDLEGYPADAVAKYASEHGADMIVVGSRGRGAVASLVLGSTSHRLIHIAECDLLVVKEAA